MPLRIFRQEKRQAEIPEIAELTKFNFAIDLGHLGTPGAEVSLYYKFLTKQKTKEVYHVKQIIIIEKACRLNINIQ